MEKKKTTKKVLTNDLDNKSVVSKTASVIVNDIDPNSEYEFVSNGKFYLMPKDTIYTVSGEMAINFIQKGIGHIKK